MNYNLWMKARQWRKGVWANKVPCVRQHVYLYVKKVMNTLGKNKHRKSVEEWLAVEVFRLEIAAVLSPAKRSWKIIFRRVVRTKLCSRSDEIFLRPEHQRRALEFPSKLNFKKFVFMLLDENVINIASPLES